MLTPARIQNDFVWNYGVKSLKRLTKETKIPFWKDAIAAWMHFSIVFKIPDLRICDENIFNSDFTKFRCSRLRGWEKRGVRIIADLFTGNELLTWQRFKEVYSIPCNYLEYYGLVHSVPKTMEQNQPTGWRQKLPSISARVHFLLDTKTFTKILAIGLMKNATGILSDIARITRKWQRDTDIFEPQSVQVVRNSMLATRYTSFHYKVVMRILTMNSFLQLIRCREN